MTAMTHASETRLNSLRRKRLRRALAAEDHAHVQVHQRSHGVAFSVFVTLFVGLAGFAWHGAGGSSLSTPTTSVSRTDRFVSPAPRAAQPTDTSLGPLEHTKMRRLTSLGIATTLAASSASANGPSILLHHYLFETPGLVEDCVGNAHGTLIGGALVVDGALCTDGVDDYVQFAEKIIPTSGSFTVAFRFKTMSTSSTDWMELISQGCSECPGFFIGRAFWGEWRSWHDGWEKTGISFPPIQTWHHVAVAYHAGSQSALYVNGDLVKEIPALPMTVRGSNTRLSRQFESNGEFHHGYIDDLRIYSGALTAAEVSRLVKPCPGDIDENTVVDGVDLAIVLGRWGTMPKDYPRADTNGDGTVDGADLAQVLGTWGACP
jgi:hypothetical protein